MDNRTPLERRIAQHVAALTFQHLTRSNLVRDDASVDEPLIWVWALDDRAVLIVNPLRIKNLDAVTKPRFEHHLATVLQGRRVVVTNHRGIFVQVGYFPEPQRELKSHPLDIASQPSPLHVPIGMTAQGPLWLSLVELDAVLIGGARRMGKTNLLHGWIAALLQGKETRLVLYDGKGGVEFERYANQPRCQVITERLGPTLGEITREMHSRFEVIKAAHSSNIADYNRRRGEGGRLERIVLVVDELAFALQEAGVEDLLVDLIARGGAVGIHPVLATQRPSSDVITPRLKGNLVARIALPVPARADSMVILDRPGAESIAKIPGRLLITHRAQLIEVQAFVAPSQPAISGTPFLPASSRLSNRELRIVRAAIAREGWYKIRELKADTGESTQYLVDLARRWELLGFLTPVQRNDRGHQLGRRVNDTLRAELGEQVN